MARFLADVTLTYLIMESCGVSVLLRTVHGNSIKSKICNEWVHIAYAETIGTKNCTRRALRCTAMDCTGETTVTRKAYPAFLIKDIQINYCFGIQINDCSNPISMDFYVQAPAKNRSLALRITNDTSHVWQDVLVPLGSIGNACPKFDFKFEIKNNTSIKLSINLGVTVYAGIFSFDVPNVNTRLIHERNIPIRACSKTINITGTAPEAFAPNMCDLQPYKDSINENCDPDYNFCDLYEQCDTTLNQPKCICAPKYELNNNGDTCIPKITLNEHCENDSDCSNHEVCRPSNFCPPRKTCNQTVNQKLCVCAPGYKMTKDGDHCIPSRKLNEYCIEDEECDIHEVCNSNNPCNPDEVCNRPVNPPTCLCPAPYKVNINGDRCVRSRSLNQTCDPNDECGINQECTLCGPGENCDMTLNQTKCMCGHAYRIKGDKCTRSRSLNQTCEPNDECGINQECTATLLCGPGENCDMTLKQTKCMCGHEFKLNTAGDGCIPSRRLNERCELNVQCGISEVCRANNLGIMYCQCIDDYTYSVKKDMCDVPPLSNYTVVATIGGILAAFIVVGLIILVVRHIRRTS